MRGLVRCVLLGIAICVLMVLPAQLVVLAQEPTKVADRPAPEVIAAWENAGAEFGWLTFKQSGQILFLPHRQPRGAEAMSAFAFKEFPTGKLKALPAPEVPFGLRLDGPEVTDAALEELAGLKQLQALDIWGTQVAGPGLKQLVGLRQLRSLDIANTQVTDEGLKGLAELKQLQFLRLTETRVTDAGLIELAGLEQLKTLGLGATRVKGDGLTELTALKQLQVLHLSRTQVTDAGLKEVAKLKQLQMLDLSFTKFTDAVTCFTFFGQSKCLFWREPGEPADVETAASEREEG